MAFGPTHLVHTDAGALAKATASGQGTGSSELGSRSSAGERLLHTQDVTGSIPVATTTRPKRRPLIQYVYFIQGEATRRIKIGKSDCPALRLYTMQTGSPDRLSILDAVPTEDALGLERVMHERFAKHRLHGEWFSPGSEILQFLDQRKRAAAKRRAWQARRDEVWIRTRITERAWAIFRATNVCQDEAIALASRYVENPEGAPSLIWLRGARDFAIAERVQAYRDGKAVPSLAMEVAEGVEEHRSRLAPSMKRPADDQQ